jgi:hypothetical protein
MKLFIVMFALFLSVANYALATTTMSFVAHQDDDLLFMNPDITSDVQAGCNIWIVLQNACCGVHS